MAKDVKREIYNLKGGIKILENNLYILSLQKGEPRETGMVYFGSDPSGAMIYVDGIILTTPEGEAKRTPTSVVLIEGRRDITYRLKNYDDESFYVDVFRNKTVSVYRRFKQTGKVITPLQSNINEIKTLQDNIVSNFTISFIGSLAAVYVAIKFLKWRE